MNLAPLKFGGLALAITGGYMTYVPTVNGYGLLFVGLLLFLLPTYFSGAAARWEYDETERECMSGYQSSLFEVPEISEICTDCESFAKCTSHDPHAGCESEVNPP